jgi:hypothetical protein
VSIVITLVRTPSKRTEPARPAAAPRSLLGSLIRSGSGGGRRISPRTRLARPSRVSRWRPWSQRRAVPRHRHGRDRSSTICQTLDQRMQARLIRAKRTAVLTRPIGKTRAARRGCAVGAAMELGPRPSLATWRCGDGYRVARLIAHVRTPSPPSHRLHHRRRSRHPRAPARRRRHHHPEQRRRQPLPLPTLVLDRTDVADHPLGGVFSVDSTRTATTRSIDRGLDHPPAGLGLRCVGLWEC